MSDPTKQSSQIDPNGDARQHAAQLRSLGFALCKPDPAEKKPTYARWGTRSKEVSDFAAGDMIGVIAGPLSDGNKDGHALAIIDLDAPEAVEQADEYLPVTPMEEGRASKPRSHRYLLVPVATIPAWAQSHAEQAAQAAIDETGHPGPFKKAFQRADGKTVIDFIGTGGQAVCPPSLHSSGERREWARGTPGEPATIDFADLWLAVCRLAESCGCEPPSGLKWPWDERPPPPQQAFTIRATGSRVNVESRAINYLAKIPSAVSRQGGHAQTFKAARCMVYGFDLGVELGFRILKDHYNPRCEPEWSDAELWHKVQDADRLPFHKPRGWLVNAERDNHKPATNALQGEPDGPPTATQIILDYFRERYQPIFKRGNSIICEEGENVAANVACTTPDSAVIDRLSSAADAPTYQGGGVRRAALPSFFKTWARVAWGDLLASLPDEDSLTSTSNPAQEEFRRLVRDAMLSEIVLGDIINKEGTTQIERRSLIDWCERFAKQGLWQSIRSKKCWCKLKQFADGELQLMVAIRQELFAQVHADKRLCEMGAAKFSRRAAKYGIGKSSRDERPAGEHAVILDLRFIAELTVKVPDDEGGEVDAS